MSDKQELATFHRTGTTPSEAMDHWLNDCWLVEVMPPTWAWAYRRLLNGDEAGSRYTDRHA